MAAVVKSLVQFSNFANDMLKMLTKLVKHFSVISGS